MCQRATCDRANVPTRPAHSAPRTAFYGDAKILMVGGSIGVIDSSMTTRIALTVMA